MTAQGTGNRRTAYHGRGEPLRAHIIEVAGALFTRDGVRAVGVNRVTAEAGISKKTLYKYFPSKDDLFHAVGTQHQHPGRALVDLLDHGS